MIRVLLYTFLLVMFGACLAGFYNRKELDKAAKVFWGFIQFDFIVELVSYAIARVYGSNLEVYAIAAPIQTAFICVYFNYAIPTFAEKNLGIYLGVFSLLLGLVNLAFLQPVGRLPSYFLTYSGFLVTALSIYGAHKIVEDKRQTTWPHFWFMWALVFFWTSTACFWCLYEFFGQLTTKYALVFNLFILSVGIIYYVSILIVFLRFPHLKKGTNG